MRKEYKYERIMMDEERETLSWPPLLTFPERTNTEEVKRHRYSDSKRRFKLQKYIRNYREVRNMKSTKTRIEKHKRKGN